MQIILFLGLVVVVYAVYFILSVLFAPLRNVPGPFLARFTNIWYLFQVHKGHVERKNCQLHETYGMYSLFKYPLWNRKVTRCQQALLFDMDQRDTASTAPKRSKLYTATAPTLPNHHFTTLSWSQVYGTYSQSEISDFMLLFAGNFKPLTPCQTW